MTESIALKLCYSVKHRNLPYCLCLFDLQIKKSENRNSIWWIFNNIMLLSWLVGLAYMLHKPNSIYSLTISVFLLFFKYKCGCCIQVEVLVNVSLKNRIKLVKKGVCVCVCEWVSECVCVWYESPHKPDVGVIQSW